MFTSTKRVAGVAMDRLDMLTVMVVEPHALGRRLLRDLLKSTGIGLVLTEETMEAALETFGSVHVDVVFTDWSSSTDAPALLGMLRGSDSTNRFVPVVVVSGFNDIEHVRQARDSGANEYLLKPFTPAAVLARLRAVATHPRPFVDAGSFFGPDRRRHRLEWPSPERRRTSRYVERRFHDQKWTGPDRRGTRDSGAPLAPERNISPAMPA